MSGDSLQFVAMQVSRRMCEILCRRIFFQTVVGMVVSFSNFNWIYRSTFTILAIIISINADFSQKQLLAMPKVLEICMTLLLTACPKAWWCSVPK
jgi:hypothetical protein